MSQTRHCDFCKETILPRESFWQLFIEPDEESEDRSKEYDVCSKCKIKVDDFIEGMTKS